MDDDGNLLSPYEDNPKTGISKGQLVVGDTAPAMKVSETGLYHIVLDLNQANDLAFPQIVVAKADYGVRGGMNSWGFSCCLTGTVWKVSTSAECGKKKGQCS